MQRTSLTVALLSLAFATLPCVAQQPPNPDKYVTREEYDKVVKELDAIKKKLGISEEKAGTQQKENEQTFEEYDKELKSLKSQVMSALPGKTKPLITGYGFAGYTDRKGEKGTFEAGLNPILLWKLSDRLFFEGELELELSNNDEGEGETELDLEYANLSYIVNDFVTLKAGKFLAPFGTFADRLHAAWINKLPDAPLPFGHDGLGPTSEIGLQASGGAPLGPTKVNYAFYVSNGPRLNTGKDEPEEAGMLHFDNNLDINDNKAVGTRIGFLPIPQLEVGYSFQYAKVGADVDASAYLHAVDIGYVRDSDLLKGVIDVRGQWVWSMVDRVTYDPDGSLGFGPLSFNNKRDGGYIQLAYRPSKIGPAWFRDLEGVVRWDMINRPASAPMGTDETRWTFGLNYWIGASTVIKAAYQTGERDSRMDGKSHVDAILVQAAMGF